ncbi:uncharacterized protein LOC111388095 [Olea europaea var. sylvestris]|uniref:uncharacterized protein LOC111388095 n=1 Tax=Olea europaea var. sylvestris TaxID=158386 RepID=UPI000C1CD95D|nr:uncharacterized protein LOC111388095 [Olea europaea var. sylvestris]
MVAPRCLLKIDLSKAHDSVGRVFGKVTPFLFVLCVEYLSRLLKAIMDDSNFNFHPKCGPQKITHLVFANDLMLFARGDVMSVKILMNCLSTFGSISRLGLNVLKSILFIVGIHGQLLENILELTNVPRGSKIEVIKAVLQRMECFWLSIFLIPATIISRIDLCLPRDEGGLGLMKLKSWNLALLTKSLWNIQHKKDSLWIRWVHQIYLKGTCICEVSPRKDHSPLFKKLLEI